MKRAFLLVLIAAAPAGADGPAKPLVPSLEARLTDGSRLRMAIVDDVIAIQTLYGRLLIPRADIRRIEFGPRPSEKLLQQMDAAVTDLASPELSTREAAMEGLLKMGPSAFPAVVRASRSDNRDLVISAKHLRGKFVEKFANEHLPEHDLDVIQTDEAKYAGHIELPRLRVWTAQFGEKTVGIADLVGIRPAPHSVADDLAAIRPDPGDLSEYAEHIGRSFLFRVTGSTSGTIYGNATYTTDSNLATAAVHAGALKAGETGVVKVTIVEGLDSYQRMTCNGVTSNYWAAFPTAFKVVKGPKK